LCVLVDGQLVSWRYERENGKSKESEPGAASSAEQRFEIHRSFCRHATLLASTDEISLVAITLPVFRFMTANIAHDAPHPQIATPTMYLDTDDFLPGTKSDSWGFRFKIESSLLVVVAQY